jgi:hypothetical protein
MTTDGWMMPTLIYSQEKTYGRVTLDVSLPTKKIKQQITYSQIRSDATHT